MNDITEKETFCYLSKATDYDILRQNLSTRQLLEIENALKMYENDELFVVIDDYEVCIDYANNPEEMFPYKPVISWYEGLIDTDELIEFIRDMDI